MISSASNATIKTIHTIGEAISGLKALWSDEHSYSESVMGLCELAAHVTNLGIKVNGERTSTIVDRDGIKILSDFHVVGGVKIKNKKEESKQWTFATLLSPLSDVVMKEFGLNKMSITFVQVQDFTGIDYLEPVRQREVTSERWKALALRASHESMTGSIFTLTQQLLGILITMTASRGTHECGVYWLLCYYVHKILKDKSPGVPGVGGNLIIDTIVEDCVAFVRIKVLLNALQYLALYPDMPYDVMYEIAEFVFQNPHKNLKIYSDWVKWSYLMVGINCSEGEVLQWTGSGIGTTRCMLDDWTYVKFDSTSKNTYIDPGHDSERLTKEEDEKFKTRLPITRKFIYDHILSKCDNDAYRYSCMINATRNITGITRSSVHPRIQQIVPLSPEQRPNMITPPPFGARLEKTMSDFIYEANSKIPINPDPKEYFSKVFGYMTSRSSSNPSVKMKGMVTGGINGSGIDSIFEMSSSSKRSDFAANAYDIMAFKPYGLRWPNGLLRNTPETPGSIAMREVSGSKVSRSVYALNTDFFAKTTMFHFLNTHQYAVDHAKSMMHSPNCYPSGRKTTGITQLDMAQPMLATTSYKKPYICVTRDFKGFDTTCGRNVHDHIAKGGHDAFDQLGFNKPMNLTSVMYGSWSYDSPGLAKEWAYIYSPEVQGSYFKVRHNITGEFQVAKVNTRMSGESGTTLLNSITNKATTDHSYDVLRASIDPDVRAFVDGLISNQFVGDDFQAISEVGRKLSPEAISHISKVIRDSPEADGFIVKEPTINYNKTTFLKKSILNGVEMHNQAVQIVTDSERQPGTADDQFAQGFYSTLSLMATKGCNPIACWVYAYVMLAIGASFRSSIQDGKFRKGAKVHIPIQYLFAPTGIASLPFSFLGSKTLAWYNVYHGSVQVKKYADFISSTFNDRSDIFEEYMTAQITGRKFKRVTPIGSPFVQGDKFVREFILKEHKTRLAMESLDTLKANGISVVQVERNSYLNASRLILGDGLDTGTAAILTTNQRQERMTRAMMAPWTYDEKRLLSDANGWLSEIELIPRHELGSINLCNKGWNRAVDPTYIGLGRVYGVVNIRDGVETNIDDITSVLLAGDPGGPSWLRPGDLIAILSKPELLNDNDSMFHALRALGYSTENIQRVLVTLSVHLQKMIMFNETASWYAASEIVRTLGSSVSHVQRVVTSPIVFDELIAFASDATAYTYSIAEAFRTGKANHIEITSSSKVLAYSALYNSASTVEGFRDLYINAFNP